MARRNNGGLAALSGVVGVLEYAGGLENAVYPAKLTDLGGADRNHDQAKRLQRGVDACLGCPGRSVARYSRGQRSVGKETTHSGPVRRELRGAEDDRIRLPFREVGGRPRCLQPLLGLATEGPQRDNSGPGPVRCELRGAEDDRIRLPFREVGGRPRCLQPLLGLATEGPQRDNSGPGPVRCELRGAEDDRIRLPFREVGGRPRCLQPLLGLATEGPQRDNSGPGPVRREFRGAEDD